MHKHGIASVVFVGAVLCWCEGDPEWFQHALSQCFFLSNVYHLKIIGNFYCTGYMFCWEIRFFNLLQLITKRIGYHKRNTFIKTYITNATPVKKDLISMQNLRTFRFPVLFWTLFSVKHFQIKSNVQHFNFDAQNSYWIWYTSETWNQAVVCLWGDYYLLDELL